MKIFDAKAIDVDSGENGRVVYSMETVSYSSSAPQNAFLIDKINGSVYFNFFAFNITDLDKLDRFRGTFRLVLHARDSASVQPLSANALNLTLYLNYDLAELGVELPASSSILRSSPITAELDEFGLLAVSDFESRDSASRNFFQLVSNGVLLVILITVLAFMLLVACFLFIIFYKKNGSEDEKKSKPVTTINSDSANPSKSPMKEKIDKHSTYLSNSCLGRMKTGLKLKCSLVKSSSFANLNAAAALSMLKKSQDNLTVIEIILKYYFFFI